MHVHFLHPTGPRDVAVEVTDPDATVADLAVALDPERPAGPLLVDDRPVPAATPLDRARIGDGAVLSLPDRGGPGAPPAALGPALDTAVAVVMLEITTGADAGRSAELTPGTYLIGRRGADPATPGTTAGLPIDDPTVSAAHARMVVAADGTVSVHDAGSTNGTWLGPDPVHKPTVLAGDTELRCGAVRLRLTGPTPPALSPTERADPAPGSRTRPWHRPPRPLPYDPEPPLAAPAPPEAPPAVTPVGVIGVVASLAVGGAMVVVLGSLTYALFALLGPVLMVANAVDSRRRRRGDLTARRACLAGPGPAAAVARGPASSLWERRTAHHDAFEVCVGRGAVPWTPPVAGDPSSWADDVAEVIAHAPLLHDAPVGLRLDPATPIDVVGPSPAGRALARSILLQATVAHGPADLQVAALAAPDRAPAWDWCRWLPHGHRTDGGSLLAGNPTAAASVASTLVDADLDEAGHEPRCLVVIDDPGALSARRSAPRTVLRAAVDPRANLVPLVLVATPEEVPAVCTTVLTVAANGSLAGTPWVTAGPATLVGVTDDTAATVARELARLDDPEVDDPSRGLPDTVALVSLLGTERLSPWGLAARWRAAGTDPAPRALLGVAADGPLVVDLVTDGPHALVAGTTGSGKSELLRTLVTSLAVGSSPDHLTFVLIDFKGGSAFDAVPSCPTPLAWSPTSTTTWLPGRCVAWRQSCATASGACATPVPTTSPSSGGGAPMVNRSRAWWWWWTSSPPWPPSCPTSSMPWWAWPSGDAASGCTWCWPPNGPRGR